AAADVRLNTNALDYAILGVYFVTVLGVGWVAKRYVKTSLDYFLSGRTLPAWITGLAFVSANLGATEILGMGANGAQYGVATVNYYWIGAVPAMVFLALALVLQLLLGWAILTGILVAAVVVLAYITLGGLSSAIYNEVLQFFVILAALVPLTIVGLHDAGGWGGLKGHIRDSKLGEAGLHALQGTDPGHVTNPIGATWIGIVFGLGFILSFGYWTTNFAEVQRALSARDLSAGQRTPLIGAYPKLLIPAVVVIPGMIALWKVPGLGGDNADLAYNNAIPLLMNEYLPNGMLGIALTGLMASFMAGVAANVSAFNTVVTTDIIEPYIAKDRDDAFYIRVGRFVTVGGIVVAIGTALIASSYQNLMNYL